MDGYLQLSAKERKACLAVYRRDRSVRRALVLLLLDQQWSYRDIGAATCVGPNLIALVKQDFAAGGVDRVLGQQRRSVAMVWWLTVVVRWLINHTPQDFDFFRSRWSCAVLALLLWERHHIRLSAETVRRGLHQMGFVWRRPRPVAGCGSTCAHA